MSARKVSAKRSVNRTPNGTATHAERPQRSKKKRPRLPTTTVANAPVKKKTARSGARSKATSKPALLSGGNPQIAKGDGDGPVQEYISAMPDWKNLVGRRLDGLIETAVPKVRKSVKWNSPFYGVEGQGWFLSFHCFAKYVKVAFLRGASLVPKPPGESKHKETRYLDIYEADELDEAQLIRWFQQSASLPGWDGGSPRLNGGIPL